MVFSLKIFGIEVITFDFCRLIPVEDDEPEPQPKLGF